MALIINHNMPATTAARNLGSIYGSLGKSIERLSSGLRINKAADDAAGLAVREMMRADIATTLQGIRNAADAVSMIQTADGSLAIIDALLIRMKELAEQAASGTYSDYNREIINSEYMAMAAEIDRVSNAADFNGIKLLDGSMGMLNGGQGVRIHFGVGNSALEDYYYINTANTRASDVNGLNIIGGDATPDIWSTGLDPSAGLTGCCGGGFTSPDQVVQVSSTEGFAFAYNWDQNSAALADESLLITSANLGRYLAGRYQGISGTTISAIVAMVNQGTQSRVQIVISGGTLSGTTNSRYAAFCLSSTETYFVGSADLVSGNTGGIAGKDVFKRIGSAPTRIKALAAAINSSSINYWAVTEGDNLWVFRKDGLNNDNLEVGFKGSQQSDKDNVYFINSLSGVRNEDGANFSLGGLHWATFDRTPATGGSFNLNLTGQNAGDGYDVKVVTASDTTFNDMYLTSMTGNKVIAKLSENLTQVQDASDGRGTIRTQEAAQQALDAITQAIQDKDRIRANLGAMQNRLEATIEHLTLQAENLQAAESRISDVDVATEMTEFTKNNILAQAAASMLAQANSLSSLALTLIRG